MSSAAETSQSLHHAVPSPSTGTTTPQSQAQPQAPVPPAGGPSKPRLPVRIRPAGPSDAPGICALHRDVFAETFGPFTPPEDMDAFLGSLVPDEYEKDMQDTEVTQMYVAETIAASESDNEDQGAGEIVGFVQNRVTDHLEPCVRDGGYAKPIKLDRLYVDYRYHGGGVARQLMDLALEEGKKRGYGCSWLGVYQKNPKARRFYEKYGFQRIGEFAFMVGKDRQIDDILIKEL